MIRIKKVTCKNFLSYGNVPTEFVLDQHLATLIRGKNGHGKSALMDLILYALYGKPYRNISKPQLINSINRSGMLVTVDFEVGGIPYQVVRGMKPNTFDIFCREELVDQSAAMRDYQDLLETQILKVNEQTFKQIAVLGSASYIPFMQLNAGQRRELIESILNIGVFSQMNLVLKDRIAQTKEELGKITNALAVKKVEASAQQKIIKIIQESTTTRITEYENKRAQLLLELARIGSDKNEKSELYDSIQVVKFEKEKHLLYSKQSKELTRQISEIETRISTITELTTCPTCVQDVAGHHKSKINLGLIIDKANAEQELAIVDYELAALDRVLTQHNEDNDKKLELLQEMRELDREMSNVKVRIEEIDTTITEISSNKDDEAKETEKLKAIGEAALKVIARKNELTEEKQLQDVAAQLLKDTGIKTAVVKEYLPVMNQLINKYLSMFNFFVDFTLDESFNESIKSRGRDVFSYSSFSEGEKRRIDFAILMAFRQLAALKNSAKTNLLILDEIVDGAFDLEARAMFNDLIANIPDSNVIVISHADASTEAYDRVIHVEKPNDFSVYSVVE